MIAYNVRIKDFLDGQQVTVYSNSIISNVGRKEKSEKEILDLEPIMEPWSNTIVRDEITMEREKENHDRSVSNSIKRTKNKVVDYARSNVWEWFVTMTFKDESIRMDYDKCSKVMSFWLNNIQKASNGNMKYIVVPEQHKKGGFHFHALISNAVGIKFEDSGYYATKLMVKGYEKKVYLKTDKHGGKKVYNIGNYRGGFTTATMIEDTERASSYISKYITKDLVQVTTGKKRYWVSKNLDLPVVTLLNDNTATLLLRESEIQGNEQYYKKVNYKVCDKPRFVKYYELDKQFFDTGLNGNISQGVDYETSV